MNLSKVNENKTNDTLVWDVAYDILSVLKFSNYFFFFKYFYEKEYNLPDLSWGSMEAFSQKINDDHETRKKFVNHFFAGGTDGQLTDAQLDETCNDLNNFIIYSNVLNNR